MRTATKPLIKYIKNNAQPDEEAVDEPTKTKGQVVEFFPGRISLSDLKAIWNDDDETYADEDLLRIRDWLYMVAELSLKIMSSDSSSSSIEQCESPVKTEQTKTATKIIALSASGPANEISKESHPLHPRLDRRAS